MQRMICKEEVKRREEEAKANMICIIESLEQERESQRSPDDSVADDDIIRKLVEVNKTMQKQNAMWWEVMKTIEEDKKEYEKKNQILREKLNAKLKKWSALENERDRYMKLVAKKEAQIDELRDYLNEFNITLSGKGKATQNQQKTDDEHANLSEGSDEDLVIVSL